jgi:hypothetical protein
MPNQSQNLSQLNLKKSIPTAHMIQKLPIHVEQPARKIHAHVQQLRHELHAQCLPLRLLHHHLEHPLDGPLARPRCPLDRREHEVEAHEGHCQVDAIRRQRPNTRRALVVRDDLEEGQTAPAEDGRKVGDQRWPVNFVDAPDVARNEHVDVLDGAIGAKFVDIDVELLEAHANRTRRHNVLVHERQIKGEAPHAEDKVREALDGAVQHVDDETEERRADEQQEHERRVEVDLGAVLVVVDAHTNRLKTGLDLAEDLQDLHNFAALAEQPGYGEDVDVVIGTGEDGRGHARDDVVDLRVVDQHRPEERRESGVDGDGGEDEEVVGSGDGWGGGGRVDGEEQVAGDARNERERRDRVDDLREHREGGLGKI